MFQLKNYTDLKKYPSAILVMQEKSNKVMFLDENGIPVWINKYYLRNEPMKSRYFASPDTLGKAMDLLEKMRSALVDEEMVGEDRKKLRAKLNPQLTRIFAELRDLGTRMEGIQFAPQEEEEQTEEEQKTQEEPKKD